MYMSDLGFNMIYMYMSELGFNINHILCEWFKCNKLSLNVDKTHYMTIGKRCPDIAISLGGRLLSKARHVKFLGIIAYPNLN